MSDSVKATQDLLAKHHRDGEQFAEMMKQTHASRFGEEFWQWWEQAISARIGKPGVVLDLDTGPASFLLELNRHLPQAKLYGVECAEYMLAAIPEELPDGCEILCADLHDPRLPLEDASVDVITASVVLHEMHQPVKTLLEAYRLLKPGGLFYILDWVRAPLERYLEDVDFPVFAPETAAEQLEDLFVHFIEHNRFSSDDLTFMLRHAGFKVVECTPLVQGRQARLLAMKSIEAEQLHHKD